MSEASERQTLSEAKQALLEKRRQGKTGGMATAPGIPFKRPIDAPPLASFGQERLWYLQQLQPASTAYNMVSAMHLTGALDKAALQSALQQVADRHSTLRTAFRMTEGNLIQQIHNEVTLTLAHEEISGDAVEERIRRFADQPFHLDQAPLVRALLLQSAEDEHTVVFVIHHIISDEWSMDVLWRELAAHYAALISTGHHAMAPLQIQYDDFAWWQRQQMENGTFEGQLHYWREQLRGDLPVLQLPADRTRPRVKAASGGYIARTLDSELSAHINTISRDSSATPFMTLLAAFAVFLYRYSGQQDILIGTPITNREQSETEHLIGFFLNTVVLRANFGTVKSFTQLLAEMREASLSALANGNLPFERLVDALNPKRDPSYNPLFQAMFVFQDGEGDVPQFPNLEVEPVSVDMDVSKFDVTLFARSVQNRFQIGMEYDSALFDRHTVERFLRGYETLLSSIASAPETSVDRLNVLPSDERNRLLVDWTRTAIDYPAQSLIHELIAAQSADSTALLFGSTRLTYGELDRRANQVAHRLISLGLEPGMRVGLCLERTADMTVGMLGILKAGCAYVPIDPAYPDERIKYILGDAGITVLLTQTHLLDKLPAQNMTVLALDAEPTMDRQATTAPNVSVSADNLAYMIYTSGSTGRPKGVRITHRNLVHSTTARFTAYREPVSRFLLLSSFAFDSSVAGIFWTLCQGGSLCLPPHGAERDVMLIAQLIEELGITHTLMLPSLYNILLEFARPEQLKSLNTVIVAGESCPLTLPEWHYAVLPNAGLYNEYGPTEATVWCSVWQMPPQAERILIGKAIPNTQLYVLDPLRQPVPIGVVGELCVGGVGVSDGYHNRPELNLERFVDNPFGHGRLYRTGDLARFLADGNLEFLGRIDDQVKLHGHRIELGEIEAALAQHPHVKEAAVLLFNGTEMGAGAPVDEQELVRRLQNHPDAEKLLADIEMMPDEAVAALVTKLLGSA